MFKYLLRLDANVRPLFILLLSPGANSGRIACRRAGYRRDSIAAGLEAQQHRLHERLLAHDELVAC